jgi:nicotinate-nucleotide--dimethylbenzimidazole phosphoribosyltransferase
MNLIDKTLQKITPADSASRAAAHARMERLTMPTWALGRLLDLAEDLSGITGSIKPPVKRKTVVTMAGDHGVVEEGVSKYPQEVTVQMIHNFVAGGAGINVLARQAGAKVVIVDMGVKGDISSLVKKGEIISRSIGRGTKNIAKGPAMTRDEAIRSIEAGIELAHKLSEITDVFATGDMGIGNTTPSSAIIAAMTGCDVDAATGRGTGIEYNQLVRKLVVIQQALNVNKPNPKDALDVLAKVGGFEIGGIAGVILGAASKRKPVLVDGVISTAGALIAHGLCTQSVDYMIAAHKSVEPGQKAALEKLGKVPLLDLNMRLGEGTGAALAMPIIDAAVAILTKMATFEEAKVTG